VSDTADPLAGSYFVESLTTEVENAAWKLIEKIEAMGGSVEAIEQGFMQDEIAASAYEYQKKIESGEKVSVGVNKFQSEETFQVPPFKIEAHIQDSQIERLKLVKCSRNHQKVLQCLSQIEIAARGTENLMPSVLEAVENLCTLGEISDTLRNVFGEYK
jgi:methylmalonyl-CoA mutase N-terminal domain/subunit